MRKGFFRVLPVIAIIFISTFAYSSSIDYRGNQSVDYIRTLSRSGSLDAADIAHYNPAGTVFMEDGVHVNFGLQFLFKDYTMETSGGTEYESDYPSLFLPNLYGVYKKENFALFAGFHVPAGGGTVKFEDGIAVFDPLPGELKGKSIYYAFTFGGAYSFNKMMSISLSARYMEARRSYKGHLTYPGLGYLELDTVNKARGIGGIIGFDIKPMKGLNIGVKYEIKTKLEFEMDTKVNELAVLGYTRFNDGEKERRDLPALLSLGAAYDITEQFKVTASFIYYFIKQANKDGVYDEYDNGYDASFSLEYKVIPAMLISFGYLYSDSGANEDTVNDFDMTLDSHNIAAGLKYGVAENVDLSLGYIYSKYIDLDNASGTVTYKKVVNTVAVGVDTKF